MSVLGWEEGWPFNEEPYLKTGGKAGSSLATAPQTGDLQLWKGQGESPNSSWLVCNKGNTAYYLL